MTDDAVFIDAGFDEESEWDQRVFQISRDEKHRGTAADGTTILVGYGADNHLAGTLCNVSRTNGAVCRLWRDHPGTHLPFSGEIVALSGIYVLDRVEHV